MTASQSLPISTIPGQSGFIDADVPCRQCGYNLRGLQMSGRCPECGLPIAVSVHGNLLQFSRPQWLETLRLGVLLIITSVLVYIVAMLSSMTCNRLVPYLIQLAGTGCFLAGSWLLTTPDPSGLGEKPSAARFAVTTWVMASVTVRRRRSWQGRTDGSSRLWHD